MLGGGAMEEEGGAVESRGCGGGGGRGRGRVGGSFQQSLGTGAFLLLCSG